MRIKEQVKKLSSVELLHKRYQDYKRGVMNNEGKELRTSTN